jgi:TetR/AcrR family transcriptional repressor of nem operon
LDAVSKPSNREKLLTEGLRLVHERGFGAASVRDIVHAAGVPQGSFTNHFKSKEAFGLEVLERYYAGTCDLIGSTLGDQSLAPLARLRSYVHAQRSLFEKNDKRRGCLYGNVSAEATESEDPMRKRVVEILAGTEAAIAACLTAAITAGELPATIDVDPLAGFILSSFQGATLLAKAQRSMTPLDRFEKILFEKVLR